MLRVVSLALVFLAVCRGQAVTKAGIEGRVTTVTGDPIPDAKLTMIRQGGPAAPAEPTTWRAQSDAQGKFVFEQLNPGGYSVYADRPGFVASTTMLSLASGQRLTGVSIKLSQQGRILGTVVDQDRKPISQPRVSLLQKVYFNGSPQFVPRLLGTIETAADGTFTVGRLSAGRYYLFVIPPALGQGSVPEESYVNTFYPEATDISAATPITVTAGLDVTGIEIRMRKEHVVHIRGTVKDPSGAAPADASQASQALMLYPRGPGPTLTLRAADLRNGEFAFDRVTPGAYTLVVRVASLVGVESIIVGKNNVDDLLVRVQPTAEVTGRMTFVGEPQSYPTQIEIYNLDGAGIGVAAPVGKDGTFMLRELPAGSYRVLLSVIPAGQYLKSIRSGGQDLIASPLVVGPAGAGPIEVVMSPNAAHASGVIRDSDGVLLQGVTVSAWSDHSFVSTTTSYDGAFDFPRLPPGDYRLLAWEKIEQGLDSLPEFRQKFDAKALTIKLDEKAQVNLVVPLIPRDAIDREAAKLP